MSGVFIAVPAGVILWGAILGWLVSPALSIACGLAIVGGVVYLLLTEPKGEA